MNDVEFNEQVLESKTPVLVDFYADWCQPCKQLDKILSKIDNIKIVKVDVMSSQTIADAYMIQTLPTVFLFSNGTLVRVIEGLQKPSLYLEAIDLCIS